MKLSLLHATRRPIEAKACQKLWMDRCENDSNVEIITAVDHDDLESQKAFPDAVIAYGQEGVCKAWNAAAAKATGDIFVIVDDDFEPCFGWNEVIRSYLANGADILHVGDAHRKDGLICHPIISRKYYETIGYVWHPNFKSVYCDNEFTTRAKAWGYVDATDGGKIDLGFIHKNPSQNYGVEDEVAKISNSKERYTHGKALYERLLTNNVVLAFTAYNRPEYLKESLDSWLKNDLSLVTSVQFFIEPSDRLTETLAVIDDFAKQSAAPVIKHINPEKYGVLRNPWELFRNLFEYQLATFVLLGEDDFVVSPDTLRFFNAMRMNGQANDLAVCAKWVGTDADQKPETWHRVNDFTGNIWGTWKDKWNKYLRDTWDFDYSSGKADETPSGWDHNIHLRVMPANNLQCIVPTQSRSRHIGVVGIHSTVDCFDDTVAWNALPDSYGGSYSPRIEPETLPKITGKPNVVVSSSGDIGDCVVSLATLVHRGNPAIYYLWDDGLTKGIVARDRKSTRLNSSHTDISRMPSSA